MKKVLAGIISAMAVVVLCLCMTACSTGIVGTYKFESMSMQQGGMSVDIKAGESFMGITISEEAFTLEIKEDGTLVFTANMGEEVTAEGTWEEKEGKYYLTIEGETQEVTLSGSKLVMENDGAKLTLKK